MKRLLFIPALLTLGAPCFASKPCAELKSEIAAKLDAKGMKGYTLEVVPNDQVAEIHISSRRLPSG